MRTTDPEAVSAPGSESESTSRIAATAEPNPIRTRRLDHVVLRVADLNRSIAFYGNVIGCPVERRIEELGLVQLRAGDSLIDLVDVSAPLGKAGGGPADAQAQNVDHFALALVDFDEAAIRQHLKNFGVEAGETGTRYGAEGYGDSIYLKDPDGNTIELKAPPESKAPPNPDPELPGRESGAT